MSKPAPNQLVRIEIWTPPTERRFPDAAIEFPIQDLGLTLAEIEQLIRNVDTLRRGSPYHAALARELVSPLPTVNVRRN